MNEEFIRTNFSNLEIILILLYVFQLASPLRKTEFFYSYFAINILKFQINLKIKTTRHGVIVTFFNNKIDEDFFSSNSH